MNRTVRWIGMMFTLCMGVSPTQAQQPMSAEPQAPGRTVQAPSELVPGLPVPRLVKFAGTLKDELGKARTGVLGVTFAVYKEQEGGAALWLETQNVGLDEQGQYTVLLGSSKSEGLPLELFLSGEPRWLGVQVNLPKEVEQPRVLLVSVPYALKAADAETLGGKPLSSFVLASSATGGVVGAVPNAGTGPIGAAIGGGGTQNFVAKFDATGANVVNSLIFDTGTNVGIGTTSPAAALHVNGDTLLVTSATTAQVQLSGTASQARFGQDGTGAFFASDTPGKAVRFYTNNGTLNEGLRVTSASNVGIGTAAPTQKLSVAGVVQSTTGGFMFPDGTVQTTAGHGGTITAVNTPSGSGLMGGATSGAANLSLINTCAGGQVLQWSGMAWVCASVGGTGTVTSVGSGLGLTGGPIVTAGTLAIDPTVVPQLAANPLVATVTAGTSITNGTCITLKVAAPGVTTSMVAIISPSGDPAANGLPDVLWSAFVDSAGTVTAEICKFGNTTAKAISNQNFNLRVIK